MAADRERVGIIGVGRMGLAMARHVAANGYPLTVCDIDADNVERAKALGARAVDTPAELGRQCDFVILGVGYDDEVKAVTLGPGGLVAALAGGTIIAISSTVSPDTIRAVQEAGAEKGVEVLDAPICRGRWFADQGKLLALVGGSDDVVARSRPIYSTFCSDIAHLGVAGMGQVGKSINNMLLWINSIGLIEAGRIAASTGIDLPTLRDALMMSSGKSQALEDWDQTTFTWALKDMQIVEQMSDKAGLSMPITGAVKELVKEARRIKKDDPPGWTRT